MSSGRLLKLAAASVALVALAYQRPVAYRVKVGAPGDAAYVEGFHDREETEDHRWRWSSALSRVIFHNAGQIVPRALLRVRLAGPPLSSAPQPRISLTLNGRTLDTFVASPEPRACVFSIDSAWAGPGDWTLAVTSDTFMAHDGRRLGVAVDRAELVPEKVPLLPPARTTLLVVLGALCLATLLGPRLGEPAAFWLSQVGAGVAAAGLAFGREPAVAILPALATSLALAAAIAGARRSRVRSRVAATLLAIAPRAVRDTNDPLWAGRSKVLAALGLAVASFFVATLALGLLLPIYTDEVCWKALNARTFLDGFVNISMYPQCTSSFGVTPPWFVLPARLIDHWLYSDLSHPARLRLIGVAILGAWIATLLVALPRCAAAGVGRLPVAVVGAALLSLGVLPFVLILNRPEQLMRLLITLFLVAPFVVNQARPCLIRSFGTICAVLLLASVLFAQHPKALAYAPVVLASALYLVPGSAFRAGTAAALALLAWHTAGYWYARVSCPEDPWLQAFFERATPKPSALLSNPFHYADAVADNLGSCVRYVRQTLFRRHYNADWLVASSKPVAVAPVVNVLVTAVWIGVAVLAVWTVARLAAETIRTRRLSRRAAMAFALFLPLVASCILEGEKNFYESGLILPFLGFILVLGLRPPRERLWAVLARAACTVVLAVSLVSLSTLWATVLPHLGEWLSRGYTPGQDLSISAFGAEDLRERVHATARLCGIDPSHRMEHLLVDELAYTALDKVWQPFFVEYTFHWYKGGDPAGLLAARGSAGMVASCKAVPEELLGRTQRLGDLCCLPAFFSDRSLVGSRGLPRNQQDHE